MKLDSKNFKRILALVFFSAIIICCIFNITNVFSFISTAFSFISPIIVALCIAFIFNVLLNALEKKVFFFMDKSKWRFMSTLKRIICLLLTYVIAFGIISLLVLVLIPDIVETILQVVKNLPTFLADIREWAISVAQNFGIEAESIPVLTLDTESLTKGLQNILTSYSNNIVDGAVDVTSSVIGGIYDTVFSLFISVYVLAQKERIGRFVKKLINAYTPKKIAKRVYHISSLAADAFSRFIGGQLVEACILGALCYVGMLILGIPNAATISVLVGVTALVPIVGAVAGISIGFLLLVITDPLKAVLFVAFMLILQQLEGNLIYPRVVGKVVGLPGVIVISVVLVGGNIGGILGALISVPTAAVIFVLLKEGINKHKLKTEKE
ncbi:MAG: AI-2E family transporter [Ruminococcaceae bacterium]|nr:AI-2E family transporter [Oscillospiraceae bacterium]